MAVSVLAGVVVVGGEGLDLGDGQVDGAGGGDGRQGAATPITTGVGGRVGDLDGQRRGTTQVGRAAVEGDRAGTRPLRHPLVPGDTETDPAVIVAVVLPAVALAVTLVGVLPVAHTQVSIPTSVAPWEPTFGFV